MIPLLAKFSQARSRLSNSPPISVEQRTKTMSISTHLTSDFKPLGKSSATKWQGYNFQAWGRLIVCVNSAGDPLRYLEHCPPEPSFGTERVGVNIRWILR